MHLDDERLQRLLDRELESEAEASIRGHLAGCEPCRAQVTAAERETAELLRLLPSLDAPLPQLQPGDVMRPGGSGLVWGRRAALVFVALGLSGVAYATPGSPVAAWVRSVATLLRPAPTPPAPPRTTQARSEDPEASGIAVSPGERLAIDLPSPPKGGLAYVSLGDSADVVVRVVSGNASFSSGINRLVVETVDTSAVFRIVLPRTASRVEIRAGGSRLLLKQGARIRASTAPTADGVYALRIPPGEL
jgi:predicted anti-sigma-YlaC factor YlaD